MNAVQAHDADAHTKTPQAGATERHRSASNAQSRHFWTETAVALPDEDHRVEFVFEHREVAMIGIYRHGYFETPHAICYAPAAIGEWRYAD